MTDQEIHKAIEAAADNYVFKHNSHKWSNNNGEAGDNYSSFIDGAKWVITNILNAK